MTPVVSIIMGSTSDLPVMEKAAKFLDEMEIPFEMHALSAHRTPAEVEAFAKGARGRGIKVIIAAAGMAAHLCGVIASMTTVPVIGVPINSTLDGMDAFVGYRTDASGNPCGYCRHQWRFERWYPCGADACRRRRATSGEAIRL